MPPSKTNKRRPSMDRRPSPAVKKWILSRQATSPRSTHAASKVMHNLDLKRLIDSYVPSIQEHRRIIRQQALVTKRQEERKALQRKKDSPLRVVYGDGTPAAKSKRRNNGPRLLGKRGRGTRASKKANRRKNRFGSIQMGPRGGMFYLNSMGSKTYVRQ